MAATDMMASVTGQVQTAAPAVSLPADARPGHAELAPKITTSNLLVVEEDAASREQLESLFTRSGYSVVTLSSAEDLLRRLVEEDVDFVITSIHLSGTDALQLIAQIHQRYPDLPIIALTRATDIQTAVDVLKLGACDFVVKPFDPAAVLESTRAALENSKTGMQSRQLRRWLKERFEFGDLLSPTPQMRHVFDLIRMAAPTDLPVLISGEPGTTKEQVAYAIHFQSARRAAPFIAVNCGGYPELLLEEELFGREKSAFAISDQKKPGKIAMAHSGTLFLDEVEKLSAGLQEKILAVLENGKFRRLGADQNLQSDVRFIAATASGPEELLSEGLLRSDLYARLSAVPIHLAPLRERALDIPHLVENFLRHHPVANSKRIAGVSDKVLAQFMRYTWPGNTRELQNVLECAILLAPGRIIEDVKLPDTRDEPDRERSQIVSSSSLRQWLKEKEKYYLSRKLEDLGGNIALTAKSCRIGVRTLSRKMRTYGLDKKIYKEKYSNQKQILPAHERRIPSKHSQA